MKLNQRGQMTIETVLIIVGLVAGEMLISSTARSQGWMKGLVSGPWKPLQAMIEDGTWTVQDSKAQNPAMFSRHGTFKGTVVE